jgi:hypothetical protein
MTAVTFSTPAPTETVAIETALSLVTQQYLDLVRRVASFEGEITEQATSEFKTAAEPLFAPEMKKSLNGKIYTEPRDKFIDELIHVNQKVSRWTLDLTHTVTSAKTKEVILMLMIQMEKLGLFTGMINLRFNDDDQITEISQVIGPYEGPDTVGGST